MTRQKSINLMHYYISKSRFSHDAPKKFYVLFRGKAFLMHNYGEFRSRFSHDAPKTLIFDALLRVKAGFLMTRQEKFVALLLGKAGFLMHPKTLIWKSRFSHDT